VSKPATDGPAPQPDFVALKKSFDENLTNGQRADIRRARTPDDLGIVPAVYRLLSPKQRPTIHWLRVVYFLPYGKHAPGAGPLGRQCAQAEINEMRLFQVVRSEAPNDLAYLRRIVQQVGPTLDWQAFGKSLFYWGKKEKRRLLEDFFLSA